MTKLDSSAIRGSPAVKIQAIASTVVGTEFHDAHPAAGFAAHSTSQQHTDAPGT